MLNEFEREHKMLYMERRNELQAKLEKQTEA